MKYIVSSPEPKCYYIIEHQVDIYVYIRVLVQYNNVQLITGRHLFLLTIITLMVNQCFKTTSKCNKHYIGQENTKRKKVMTRKSP